MIDNKKVLIISGNLIKHKYFVIYILKRYQNCAVIFEKYPKDIRKNYTDNNSDIVKKHFQDVQQTDKKLLQNKIQLNNKYINKKTLLEINKGELNSRLCLSKIKKFKPDLIVLCATSIIKGKLYKDYKGKIINFHAGLSQYFRGAGCNVWAIYYNKLERIGATIHFINRNIDSGKIITQGIPRITKNDNSHTIGVKVAKVGSKLIIKVIDHYLKNNNIPSSPQQNFKSIKLCKKKDFNEKIVLKINQLIVEGIVIRYLNLPKKSKLINNLK